MLKNIFFLISLFSIVATCAGFQDMDDKKAFNRSFVKCEFKLVKKDTTINFDLIYFEVQKIDSFWQVGHIKGNPSSKLRDNLVEILGCMNASEIKQDSFSCIYAYEYDDLELKPSLDREKLISEFKLKFGITNDPLLIHITSLRTQY